MSQPKSHFIGLPIILGRDTNRSAFHHQSADSPGEVTENKDASAGLINMSMTKINGGENSVNWQSMTWWKIRTFVSTFLKCGICCDRLSFVETINQTECYRNHMVN